MDVFIQRDETWKDNQGYVVAFKTTATLCTSVCALEVVFGGILLAEDKSSSPGALRENAPRRQLHTHPLKRSSVYSSQGLSIATSWCGRGMRPWLTFSLAISILGCLTC